MQRYAQRKSKGDIAEEIKKALEKEPLSINELSGRVGSNWLTVNEVLQEMKQKGKVLEIVSTDKIRLFKLARDDTYLDLPLNEEAKKLGYYIFNEIKNEWQNKKKAVPTQLDVQKVAVNVIDALGLNNKIPTVWYIFGKITVLKYDEVRNYTAYAQDYEPENSEALKREIIKAVALYAAKTNLRQRIRQQYLQYNNKLYQLKEEIAEILLFKDLNDQKVRERLERLLATFFYHFPVENDANAFIDLGYDSTMLLGKILIINDVNRYKKELYDTFNLTWEAIASYLFFDSVAKATKATGLEREKLRQQYFENLMNSKLSAARDHIANLQSIYYTELSKVKEIPKYKPRNAKEAKVARMIRNIFWEMSEAKEEESAKS